MKAIVVAAAIATALAGLARPAAAWCDSDCVALCRATAADATHCIARDQCARHRGLACEPDRLAARVRAWKESIAATCLERVKAAGYDAREASYVCTLWR